MKYLITLVAIAFTLTVATPGFSQGRGAAQSGAKTSKPAKTKTSKPAKKTSKPKEKPVVKPKKKVAATRPSVAVATNAAPTNSATGPTRTPNITTATPTIPPVRNATLEARLQPMLPNGINITDAAKGFKNWGRFVAAVHASNNLNIPFRTLKAKMTGDMPLSLGQAIQAIRSGTTMPTTMNSRTTTTASAVTQAEQQAAEDFRHVRDDIR